LPLLEHEGFKTEKKKVSGKRALKRMDRSFYGYLCGFLFSATNQKQSGFSG
jgi:hypothetical protein